MLIPERQEDLEITKGEYFSIANVIFLIVSLLAIFSWSNIFLIIVLWYALIIFYQNLFNVKSKDIMNHLFFIFFISILLFSIPFLFIIWIIIIYIGVIAKNS